MLSRPGVLGLVNRKQRRAEKRSLPVINRTCGNCTACCYVLEIKELGKGYHEDCKHVTHALVISSQAGCGIYEERPHSCRVFQCGWLQGLFSEGARPDKLGIMFHETSEKSELGVVPVAWEVWEGAAEVPATKAMLLKLSEKIPVVIASRTKKYVLGREDVNVDFA